MKNYTYLAVAAGLVLSGCSAAFKTAETPDDVYYSYGRTVAKVDTKIQEEDNGYASYFDESDDRYLRMKVQNRDKWNTIDDVNYWYGYNNPNNLWNQSQFNMGLNSIYNMGNNPFAFNSFNMGMGMGMGWNNPFMFNNFYNTWNNPFCWNRPVMVVSKYPAGTGNTNTLMPRPGFNKGGYSNSVFDRGNYNTGTKYSSGGAKPAAGYGNSNLFRSIFGNGTSNGSNGASQGYSRPSRLFESSGSNGASGGSSGSSRSSGSSSSGSSSSSSGSRGGRGGN